MLKFTIEAAELGVSPDGLSWLIEAHLPSQLQKAMQLVREERLEFGRPFDDNLRMSISGRVHVKLHQSDWEYSPGLMVAGVYLIGAGPHLPEDGASFVDLIEVSWNHEWNLGWDSLEHEFAHFIEYRSVGNPSTHETDWTNIGHGTALDPYLQALNAKILRAYPPRQEYFPGLLPSFSLKMNAMMRTIGVGEARTVQGCVVGI